jgi:murein L,D-transpeptidase YcbB/YkuD
MIRTRAWTFAALAALAGCGSEETAAGEVSRSWNPLEVKEVGDVPAATMRAEIERQLKTRPAYATDEQWTHVRALYKSYQHAPLWLDDDGVIRNRADALVDALVNATTDAIRIDQYPLFPLAGILDTLRRRKDNATADQFTRADLLLTSAYVALSEDYLTGQVDPKSVAQSWHIDVKEEEVDSALARSLRESRLADAIQRMRPQDDDYEMLRQKLGEYRKAVSAGGWAPVAQGKPLKRGDRDNPARLQALRNRLQAEGIAVSGDSGAAGVFDQALAAGIAQFQARHGIGIDSMLGKETLDAMNVPATFRLAQIASNLERYRWLPRALGNRYIFVNVPAFKLEGYENGKRAIEMKVIVGAEYDDRATPVFSDRMEFVVFRPYWNVTDDIARNELFPKFASSGVPADYEIYSDKGVQRIRQKPGPKNSLGLVKFMFPNDFNIYLHDTPQDNLFKEDIRAFSHGCIRVEKPEELAQWVLGWDRTRVERAMQNGSNNQHVKLPNSIPVYIAYMTTFVRDGHVWFGNDLYSRDQQLAQAVWGGAMPSGEAVRAVAALRELTD